LQLVLQLDRAVPTRAASRLLDMPHSQCRPRGHGAHRSHHPVDMPRLARLCPHYGAG